MPIELNTPDKLEYHYYPVSNGFVQFRVRAPNDAHLILAGNPNETLPVIEIFIGGWGNTKSIIRYNKSKPEVCEVNTPNILSPTEFRGFWVRVTQGVVTVGREGEQAAFLSWQDTNPFLVNYIGVCTGWGANGSWIIDDGGYGGSVLSQPSAPYVDSRFGGAPNAGGFGGAPCWIPSRNGQVPPGAVQGGQDGEPIYVARARHGNELIPGKLLQSHNVAYVPYGGAEHPHSDYEVLCGCNPHWVRVSGNQVPPNAVPAGETGEGEPLFVGRVNHEGSVTTGKVQQSHGVCYIPYGGQELAFQNYEVLTTN